MLLFVWMLLFVVVEVVVVVELTGELVVGDGHEGLPP